ncbi:HDOD domain-containing protein [Sinimarinibacterium sp. CAU 1509]|uniref:serine/threonine protein kinase n=1 Tax=Sinimarinibacterium sp. CAU 1509 TaxID=2562283 RepID=UPI0010AB61FD|nr:serine/threonine protein kinase [Sinimarinibacterium sp. CAU 1509]TJY64772.1 HDOD domain-containing protein [Sinimarinibacterium sp. CAU 1509]
MGKMIGRFEVMRPLGRGAHGAVFLARDPQVDRVVAIKLMQDRGDGAPAQDRVLQEARAAGQLRHSGIVTVFDVGEHQRLPYIVCEFIEARTLAQVLSEDGALPAERAVPMMISLLDALQHAHTMGVVHRDLKPANILIDAQDQPRITDFGIAVRCAAESSQGGALVGTPRYMAPEYITEGVVGPQNDVFAAGLVLYEMLFGVPAYSGDNIFQVLHRIANQPIVLPADAAARIDEPLLDALIKATAREPELRFASAAQMGEALKVYAAGRSGTANGAGSAQSTLDFLLRRMSHKSDFPAMSASIRSINRLAISDQSSAAVLANEILKDFALTNKILRLANSAFYRHSDGGRVRTVSRAIVILGFDLTRDLAISLVLFEHIRDQRHAALLKDEFLRATFGGLLARELASQTGDPQQEEIFVCAMFRNLGRLLSCYYFRDEAEMVARIVAMEHCDEDMAAQRVLGVSYRELGIGVARSWGFPGSILDSMTAIPAGRVSSPRSRGDHLRLYSACANALVEASERSGGTAQPADMAAILKTFGEALGLNGKQAATALDASVNGLKELVQALGLQRDSSAFLRAVTPGAEVPSAPDAQAQAAGGVAPLPPETEAGDAARDTDAVNIGAILQGGIQDIGQALIDDTPPADVLRIIAEIVYRALSVQRVLLCVRNAAGDSLVARHGFGTQVDQLMSTFRVPLGGGDIFDRIVAGNLDVLVSDAAVEKIRKHLPDWHRERFGAASFLLLPMRVGQRAVGLIYADVERANSLSISPEHLSLLRTLRDQARLAVKQSLPR